MLPGRHSPRRHSHLAQLRTRPSKAVRETRRTVKALEAEPVHRPPGRFVEVDGVRVHYIAKGKGRPVVLIHGNGTMAEDFVICGLVDQLARNYRVIAIDRPGFGHTDRPRWRVWTALAQAHLVHRVLERLNAVFSATAAKSRLKGVIRH